MEVKKERRARLAAALRSGEFEQTTGQLRRVEADEFDGPAGYCCLGVACEVFRRETGIGNWLDNTEFEVQTEEYDANDVELPRVVADYFGFRTVNGEFYVADTGFEEYPSYENSMHSALIVLNDGRAGRPGLPFEKIADAIEAEPSGLVGELE